MIWMQESNTEKPWPSRPDVALDYKRHCMTPETKKSCKEKKEKKEKE